MLVDFNEASVIQYQNARLSEGAAPKSVNEEVGFLLRILGDLGDLIRIRLRKKKMLKLKVRQTVGKAYTLAEKDRMLAVARRARSPHIYPALALALNAGMRDAETQESDLGTDRLHEEIPGRGPKQDGSRRRKDDPAELNAPRGLLRVWRVVSTRSSEASRGVVRLPFGKPNPSDPTRPVTTLKTAWNTVRTKAMVKGRWHDNRHTLITELAESGAGDQTIMDIAGHVSKQMLNTTATSAWRQSARRLERSSRNRRMAPQTRRRILDRLTAPRVWGTHIEHRVIEMDAERTRIPKRIAQNHPQLRSILKGSTHKNPHNR